MGDSDWLVSKTSSRVIAYMRIIDLFSGAGGLTFGFYYRLWKKGFVYNRKNQFVFANEFDSEAACAFLANYPNIPMLNCDIKVIDEKKIVELTKGIPVDIIIGGPPCQSFSTAGQRQFDDKAKLYEEYFRILEIVHPKMFLFENVKGLLSMREVFYKEDENGNIVYKSTDYPGKTSLKKRKRPVVDHYGDNIFVKITARLEHLGYKVYYETLNAVNYGVPENRERVFIIGVDNTIHTKWIFPPKKDAPPISIMDAISDLPELAEGEQKTEYEADSQTAYQELMRSGCNQLSQHYCGIYGDKIRTVIKNVKQGQGRDDFNKLIIDGVVDEKYKLTSGYKNTYGRLVESLPCPTITNNLSTPSGLRCIHYAQNRALSPREGARIQSFPDWYSFSGGKDKVTSQIGNAVPPLLSLAMARQIESFLKKVESEKDVNDEQF